MKYKKTVLDNGLSVISSEALGKSTTVLVLVATGSMNENEENNGVSHFLEHMCFKGTEAKTGKEIMRFLDGLGAETNAFTSFEYTGYYVKSIHKHWSKTLAVVADIFNNSTFPESEIETEKGVVCGEIAMYQDQPTSVVGDMFRDLAYPNQMAGKTILGPSENIQAMQRQDFLDYKKSQYTAQNTTVIVSGDVDHKKILAEVKKHFADINDGKTKKRKKTKIEREARLRIQNRKTEQSHVRIGYHALSSNDKDLYAGRLLSVILGGGMSSRLFERIREDLGMGYYVGSRLNSHQDVGYFEILAGVDSARVPEYLSEIRLQILSLLKDEISQKEINRARDYLLGNAEMALEASDDVAYFLAKQDIFGDIKKFSAIKKHYKEIKADDLKRVAKKIFKDKNLFCAILGGHDEKQETEFLSKILLK